MDRFINNLKTVFFLGLLFGIVLAIGDQFGPQGLFIAFIIGGAMNIVAYFFSDSIALTSMQAQEVDQETAGDLVEMVDRLARNAGLPRPRVYIAPQEAPNAFATGRNPKHAAVCVTRGALRLLSYDELEGVIGHELSHVKNRDTLTSAVAATMAGALVMLSRFAFFLPLSGGSNNRREGHPLAALLMIIFAPLAALLIQMAISRSREFVADADGARLAGTPQGLINALRKLEATSRQIPLQGEMPTQNHMFIVQPLSGMTLSNLFSSHPPTEERIKRLEAMVI